MKKLILLFVFILMIGFGYASEDWGSINNKSGLNVQNVSGSEGNINGSVIENDIIFSNKENLTTLDDRIISNGKNDVKITTQLLAVELDNSRAPITEKEFVSGFLKRIK
mgnify:CR=1 FL=1